jgi:hypothetical protein
MLSANAFRFFFREENDQMLQESFIDTSRPSAGRVYDYLLGGSHNFDVDRQAADRVVKFFPFLPKAMRLQRWCLQDLALNLTQQRGLDVLIDFGSGLPTMEHLHSSVAPGTTVIYSDSDPIVVEYAHEILKDVPGTYYFQADARHPEELLGRPEVQEILNGRTNVGAICWGIAGFLEDKDIRNIAQILYTKTGPNSVWAFNAQGANSNSNDPNMQQLLATYKQMGAPFHVRTTEQYMELIKPWRIAGGSFTPLTEWQGFDQSLMTADDLKAAGPGGGGYGAYLTK